MNGHRSYIAIDLKSFYASVECIERGLNPLTTHLVVADNSRTDKTICLAVSPSLKAYGIGGRPRLFEVKQRIREINRQRRNLVPGCLFNGKSVSDTELKARPDLEADFLTAVPRMAHYIAYSSRIYTVYLKFIAPEDIHVYSIDEAFFDVTDYLTTYKLTASELARKMVKAVLAETGITATAGIGTNLYLAKVAMDIVAKHMPPDSDGVRIATLDEMEYRRKLWGHQPLTSFWQVGRGTAQKLALYGLDTMGKIARCSLDNEDLLYQLFGINAELLIDHAWGWEPCTMEAVKAYKPENESLSRGQVLHHAYDADKARVVVWEMADAIALELVEKRIVTDQLVLTVGYDVECLTNPAIRDKYKGRISTDFYGRKRPEHARGTANLGVHTSSSRRMTKAVTELFDRIVCRDLLIRRIYLSTNHVISETQAVNRNKRPIQLELFTDYEKEREKKLKEEKTQAKERRIQEASIRIKQRFGRNSLLKGVNFSEGATARERNEQIGGHKA